MQKALALLALLGLLSGSFLLNNVYASGVNNNINNNTNNKLSPWKGSSAGLGFLMATGDTKTYNLNANLNLNYKPNNNWSFISKDQFQRSSSASDGVTAWVLDLKGQANYNFSKKQYSYGSLDYIDNKFDGYNYRMVESLGYGRNISMPSNMKLSVQAGPGFEQNIAQDTHKRSNIITFYPSLNYSWNFTEKSSLSEDLSSIISKQTTLTTSETNLTTNICNNFNLQLSYKLVDSTKPRPGKYRVNTLTSVNLLYNFV